MGLMCMRYRANELDDVIVRLFTWCSLNYQLIVDLITEPNINGPCIVCYVFSIFVNETGSQRLFACQPIYMLIHFVFYSFNCLLVSYFYRFLVVF